MTCRVVCRLLASCSATAYASSGLHASILFIPDLQRPKISHHAVHCPVVCVQSEYVTADPNAVEEPPPRFRSSKEEECDKFVNKGFEQIAGM